MEFKKPNPELSAYLEEALAQFNCGKRKMFGQPAYFISGNMFAGIFGDDIFVRLSERDRQRIMTENDEAAPFEPLEGRPMKEYVVIPDSIYNRPPEFQRWLGLSADYASSLPAKVKKSEKRPRGA